jgi:hypothetical protein
MSRVETRFAGFGGQGILFAGITLGRAACLYAGKHATQTQSYGTEARGGASRCDVVIDDREVDFPGVTSPDVFVAFSQEAYDKLAPGVRPGGIVFYDPELVKAMLHRYSEFYMEMYERMFIAGDGAIDLIRPCDDFGTQISLLFSPTMWNEYFAKNTRKLVDLAHKYNCFYLQHSCGAVRGIIPNLIECGVDVLEPIQKVKGMEVDGLKRDFGDKLAFQGGVDTQHLLPCGTPQEVRKETEYIIETLSVNGGYILAPSQDFEGDVPIENILALYDARKKFL